MIANCFPFRNISLLGNCMASITVKSVVFAWSSSCHGFEYEVRRWIYCSFNCAKIVALCCLTVHFSDMHTNTGLFNKCILLEINHSRPQCLINNLDAQKLHFIELSGMNPETRREMWLNYWYRNYWVELERIERGSWKRAGSGKKVAILHEENGLNLILFIVWFLSEFASRQQW